MIVSSMTLTHLVNPLIISVEAASPRTPLEGENYFEPSLTCRALASRSNDQKFSGTKFRSRNEA